MALNTINTDAISFKKLSGKVHTQQNFAVSEEGITTNVQSSYSTVFANNINPSPTGITTYWTDGVVEKVKFQIDIIPDTEIAAGRSQGYRLKLPADYNTFGELYPIYSAGTYLHRALGRLQIVPALYGTLALDGTTKYDPKLYQTNGSTEITKFDAINWYFDPYSGILFVQDPPAGYDISASRPGFLEAFLYVGEYINDKLDLIVSGDTGTTGINIGGAVGIFKDKIGNDLRFKSLVGTGGIAITGTSNNVVVYYTGSTATTTTANNGLTKVGDNIRFGGTLTGDTVIDYYKGIVDKTFNIGSGFDNIIHAIAVQADKKILVGGYFNTFTGSTQNKIIRLNVDGSIDNTFNIGTGFNGNVLSIEIQNVDKILVGGQFTTYTGATANGLIRLNPDGSVDTSFNIGSGFGDYVQITAIQPDNKILVGGQFTTFTGSTADRFIRLNADGTKDNTFNIGSGFDGNVRTIAIQSDNKILVGGVFTTFTGSTQNNVIRLNSNGTKDSTFNVGSAFNAQVYWIAIQDDNKILLGGQFTTYTGSTNNRIIRLNSDGTKDSTFNVGSGFDNQVFWIRIQDDDKILVGGLFTTYSGATANKLVRLNVNGSIDTSFNLGSGFDNFVRTITIQDNDNKILVGGFFNTFTGSSANKLIRLNPEINEIIVEFNSNGLEYGSDFSQYYNNRSLVDKEYVDNAIGNITGTSAQNIYSLKRVVIASTLLLNNDFVLFCNAGSAITLTAPVAPIDGQVYKIKDVSGNAGINNITINGNGKDIDGSSTIAINTDRGGVEMVYDSDLDEWYVMNFVG